MRVLVTRPRHQSEQLINALEAKGHSAALWPLLDIEPVIYTNMKRQNVIEKLQCADKLIVVSANASNLALPLLLACIETDSDKLFAIGPSTAKVIEQEGYKAKIPEGEYNSESLLELPAFSHIENQKIIVLCGKGGRDYLEQRLREKGAQVERVELYTRVLIPDNKIDTRVLSKPDVLTAMSGDTAAALDGVLVSSGLKDWKNIPLIVPGKRVAGIAFEKGFTKVLCSTKPTTESLLDVLVELE